MKIQVSAYVLSCHALFRYVYYAFKVSFSHKANLIINGVIFFFIALTFLTNYYLWECTYVLFALGNIYITGLVVNIIWRNIYQHVEGKYYLYVAIISSVTLYTVSLVNVVWGFESNFFIPVFQPILVLSLALYTSEKYENSYQTIAALSQQLTVLDKLKDDFLVKTSHELKTPLNGIINIAQSLLDGAGGSLSTQQKGDIELITRIGRRLSSLVYDILDYSKLKIMDISLNNENIDLQQVTESTADIFRYVIIGKDLTIINTIPPNTLYALADKNRLKQILTNLLDNAIKFTPAGSITIAGYSAHNFVYVEIIDTGVGIPEDKLETIFSSYEQVDSKARTVGTGLGLAITRQLVELHGGRIFATSQIGRGSNFTFSLPLSNKEKVTEINAKLIKLLPSNQGISAIKLPHTVNVASKFSILTIDDDYSNLKALLNVLTISGYNVTITNNAESGLQLLDAANPYDLCILDVMMPGMSGFEACRKIRESFSPLDLPILMLSAKTHEQDVEAGFMAGVNDFVEKPFAASELKCRVNTLVQLKSTKEQLLKKESAFLQAQIKPHFLYNALNTISSFCYSEPVIAGELLAELGVFLRSNFDFTNASTFVTIEKELRVIKAYVAIEKARFGEQLAVEYIIDPLALPCMILPLTIQPLIENAIKHGLLKTRQGGNVTLKVFLEDGSINIMVIDDGVGFAADTFDFSGDRHGALSGVGLSNINDRLSRFYGTALKVSSQKGLGTTVSFKVPAK